MLETETVLDRRRLRRSVTLWRAAGLAAIAIAIGVMTLGTDKLATLAGEKQIARITLEGTITEDRDQLKMLKDIADDNSVSGVLLYVNSPGGTTTGGEAFTKACGRSPRRSRSYPNSAPSRRRRPISPALQPTTSLPAVTL